MKLIKCKQCGGNEFDRKGEYMICRYCNSHYLAETDDYSVDPSANHSGISLTSDVERLLRKCKSEPKKARKYANLILDIDPTNREARKYL